MKQAKLDLTKEYKTYYTAKTMPEIVEIEVLREEWGWKLLIRMPEFVTPEIVEKARQEVTKKKKLELVNEVKFEKMKEGK